MTSQPPLISGAESASKLHIMSTEATLHCYSDSTVLNSSAKEMHTSDQRVIESDLSNHDLTRSDWLSPLQNPINWSPMRKWTTVFLLVITNFIAATYTSAFEPALPAIMVNFHSANDSVASLTVSIYTIGYCLGPFIIASMSELYGRATVLYPGYIGFMLALAVCGSSRNLLLSVIFRAIMGFAAITFVLMCPAIVADLIPREERGLALSIMSAGPVVGPTIG
ncbi:hypothetical protein EYC80_006019 [Monilinia laxa]|uniref:Major facilitator superfamily (MFS) profile domain-containing protein n=1 Tax=Monilinia laxa TaxID=61186 RepID=A0A5N6KG69_MONLA|nr:hypothetical protein EYC80_006019 [Monilinia laxa]